MIEIFRASTQYSDWRGTAAADDMHESISEQVRSLDPRGGVLVGISMNDYEKLGMADSNPFIYAHIMDVATIDEARERLRTPGPVRLRKVQLDLTMPQFFKFFKRFAIALSRDGILTGRECEYDEDDSG